MSAPIILAGILVTVHTNDNALRVDVVDRAGAPGDDHGPRVTGRDVLHAGADKRRAGAEQRHRLALHVRSHERAVGVVVLQERDERGGHRDQLLRRDVDELDAVARREDEVAGLAGVDAVVTQAAVRVQQHVGLGDDVLVFLPRGQVERVGFGSIPFFRRFLPPPRSSTMSSTAAISPTL